MAKTNGSKQNKFTHIITSFLISEEFNRAEICLILKFGRSVYVF